MSEFDALPALRQATSLSGAVEIFQHKFERAGVTSYTKQEEWAQRALSAFKNSLGLG
jgi:hypothetical protein